MHFRRFLNSLVSSRLSEESFNALIALIEDTYGVHVADVVRVQFEANENSYSLPKDNNLVEAFMLALQGRG